MVNCEGLNKTIISACVFETKKKSKCDEERQSLPPRAVDFNFQDSSSFRYFNINFTVKYRYKYIFKKLIKNNEEFFSTITKGFKSKFALFFIKKNFLLHSF